MWVVATWAKYLSISVILQKGSEADKRTLPVMKLSNRPRPVGLKRRNGSAMAEQIVVGGNQRQRRRRGPNNTVNAALSDNDSSERSNNRGGGRIRVTDDSAVTIGAEVEVRAEHVAAVNATKTKESSDETRCGHRRQLKN